ncbi:uncharacterized protein [Triticum aestivum]|uniref:uncharacterized protein n=1 Tax=Triticum aestivum TaxID=4565 RepID=UPI001D02E36D|nr:uncharacterized protein LOC123074210 [Triticum aestivum]
MSRSKADPSDAGSFAGAMFTSDRLNELYIKDHVPVVPDLDSPSYNAWRTYFTLLFRSYRLIEHVDGSVDFRDMKDDDEWLAVDACIVKWFFFTISGSLFNMVNSRDPSAYAMWTRLCDLFLDNQLQRRVFLQGEFFTMQQNDLSIDEYCTWLKVLADELRHVGMNIDDFVLLTNLLRGLHPDLGQSAANLSLITPTYAKAVTYLRMEEKRLRHSTRQATHAALHVGLAAGTGAPPAPTTPRAPTPTPPPAPAPSGGRKQKGRGGRACNSNAVQRPPANTAVAPPPPWLSGYNPWTGVVHAYSMPVPRPPAPGILGPRPASHQALLTTPAHGPAAYGGATPYGGSAAYGGPPAYGAYGGTHGGVWDPALLSALHVAPSPSNYSGGGDWYMDTGTAAHMASNPGCSLPEGSAPM